MRRDCPWREAERRFNVEVEAAVLPDECGGAVLQRRPDRIWILIDPRLSPVEQRCRLAHELVHLDRDSSWRCRWAPRTMDALVVREELAVDQEVADWLVPFDRLGHVVDAMVLAGVPVTATEVAEEFGVTRAIASTALRALARARDLQATG